MQFEWDESKRQENLRKHGIDFIDAIRIFEGETFTFEDIREDYGEERYWTIGMLSTRTIIVIHTYRAENIIRILSARKATKHEQKRFFF